ncbi:hypothetical protein [Pseudomonas sp. EMN2]|uniref:hypothetical protein n=1 Tax=Pseudomonas sp. EMN2 TaxID=2615212 RepID=UPI00129BF884|nr:hypothetical protein [Pseudomonas sp. EMN2]
MQPSSLFDILYHANDLFLSGVKVQNWFHECGSNPATFRLETRTDFHRFEEQSVTLAKDGSVDAKTVDGVLHRIRMSQPEDDLAGILAELQAAGFNIPTSHPLLSADGSPKDSVTEGFQLVHTGGGCMAMRRDYGTYHMLLTSHDGSDVPDLEDWEDSWIGVYHESREEPLVCVTAQVWQQVITAAGGAGN